MILHYLSSDWRRRPHLEAGLPTIICMYYITLQYLAILYNNTLGIISWSRTSMLHDILHSVMHTWHAPRADVRAGTPGAARSKVVRETAM